jgi:S-(hydroxymethyl)glutathione dehydrogenase / alcohol dehydrogenase
MTTPKSIAASCPAVDLMPRADGFSKHQTLGWRAKTSITRSPAAPTGVGHDRTAVADVVYTRTVGAPPPSPAIQKEAFMKATAAVLYEINKPLVVEDVEVLEPGPHEVRVRWIANGVCHSDLHVIKGDSPHPLPVVLGHEAAGVVEKVGPGVETVAPGDHVCSSYIPSCGKCWYCIGGQPTMCALRDKPRWFMLDGTPRFQKNGQGLHHYLQVAGYATYSVLLEEGVIPIRTDAPLDVVCLVSCGVLAGAGPVFNRAKVPPGASVAVFGCGGVGLNTIQAARLVGAGKVIAVDVVKQKLEWAEEFGATHVVDASRDDPIARVQALSGTGGVDYAFEVVGIQKTIEQAFLSIHRGGMAVVVGVCPAGTRLSIDPLLLLQQRTLTGTSFGGGHQRTDVPMLIDLFMAEKYKLRELISRRLPLTELNHAFDLMLQGEVKRSVVVYE